ncbi:MAG: hypothetical protein ACE5GX_07965 [Thermoanaerobaculia bacterium]
MSRRDSNDFRGGGGCDPRPAPDGRAAGVRLGLRVLTALLTLAGGPVLAQDPAPAPPSPAASGPPERFGETIDVRILNLEVQVRDSQGRFVTGLPPSAFRVQVGPDVVPIAHFDEVKRGDPREPMAVELAPVIDPLTRELEGSNYLFFLDNEVTLKARRNFVLKFLRTELDRLEPGDRASVVAFDGKQLEVLSEWSDSVEALDRTFGRAMTLPANGIRHLARRRMPGFIANWEGNASRRSVLAAAAAMRSLPTPPGRKVLILVAGSWDPIELSRADTFASWCVSGDCGGLRVLRVLTDTANFLDYSIVAVDVEGRDVDLDWQREKRLQEVLTYLAQETGGEVLLNGERRRMLARAAQAGLSYYSIAVYPPADLADLRLGVRVLVDVEGLTAYTQGSFVDLSRQHDEQLEVLNALLFRNKSLGGFPVTVGPPGRLRSGRAAVPVTIAVPLAELEWLPTEDGFAARYEIQIATQDARDNASAVETETFEIRRVAVPGPADFEFVELEVNVRRRKQTLSVVIRDRQGDAGLSVVMPFEPRPKKYKKRIAESADADAS